MSMHPFYFINAGSVSTKGWWIHLRNEAFFKRFHYACKNNSPRLYMLNRKTAVLSAFHFIRKKFEFFRITFIFASHSMPVFGEISLLFCYCLCLVSSLIIVS